jgi:hypothetical protein
LSEKCTGQQHWAAAGAAVLANSSIIPRKKKIGAHYFKRMTTGRINQVTSKTVRLNKGLQLPEEMTTLQLVLGGSRCTRRLGLPNNYKVKFNEFVLD